MATKMSTVVLTTAVVLFMTIAFGSSTSLQVKVQQYNATEGGILTVTCKTSKIFVIWTKGNETVATGKTLDFFEIKRTDTDYYSCVDLIGRKLEEKVYVNVQYPGKLLQIGKPPGPLHEFQTYSLSVTVEGNPAPNTSFISEDDDKLVFDHIGEGTFNITIGPLTHADSGIYQLMCNNAIGNDTKEEEISVLGPLSPRRPIHDSLQTRVGEDATLNVPTNDKQYNATEGGVLTIHCISSKIFAHWERKRDNKTVATGKTLNFFKIKRTDTDYYACYDDIGRKLEETVYVNVQYPGKLLQVGKPPGPLNHNQTYSLSVTVEGNPAPNTTFISEDDGNLVFDHIGEGTFNITVGPLTCADGGTFQLMSSNIIGNDTVEEEILVYCPPSPRLPVHDSLQPRLGENITLKVPTMGYPFPTFNWTMQGKPVHSLNKHFESDVPLKNFQPDEFGDYILTMKNDLGVTNHTFKVMANGPPGPVTELKVTDVQETSVNLAWVSGYDYKQNQTYIVKSFNGSTYKDIARFEAKDGDHGFNNVSHVVSNLERNVKYNLSVVANNSKGQGPMSSHSVMFTTGTYDTHTVTEGDGVFLLCNNTLPSDQVFWTRSDGSIVADGRQLSIFKTTRNNTGIYLCNEIYQSTTIIKDTVLIDVLYPEKILSLEVLSKDVLVNESYIITLNVEGNPTPTTTISQNGSVLFSANETGIFNASVTEVSCSEFGSIELTCSNTLSNETRTEVMLVHCPPAPKGGVVTKFRPRLEENVTLRIDSIGYPYPTYTWSFNGTVRKNETADNEDEYQVEKVNIGDFGAYTLMMSNTLGTSTVKYTLEAYGPPDPVTKLGVNNVTVATANITFVSGYDYDATANFIVQSFNGKTYEDITSFEDKSKVHRPANVSHVIENLSFGTVYNLTIVANNSRGMGQRSPAFVLFTTKVPYNTYDVLEGDNFTLTCNASANVTDVHWETKAGERKSNGSELDFVDINRNYSGYYECVGQSETSNNITKLDDILINVQYPAKILNMSTSENYIKPNGTYLIELEVEGTPSPNITFTKLRDGSVIFARNATGIFTIFLDPVECTDQGQYQLKCINQIGSEMKDEDIYVYCPPVVDPKAHITKQFYPRLGNMTMVEIENYGYPYPNYTWKHDKTTLPHKDTNISSLITVNVTVGDFGEYSVDMDNEYGDVEVSFQLIPKGPPDAVSGLQLANSTFNSVSLSWLSGYNYGSNQTFMVMSTDGKSLQNFTDTTTKWHENRTYTVTGLDSSTPYNLTVVSRNKDGTSDPPQGTGTVQFRTSASPSPHKSSNKKAVIGGVLGAVCFLAIIVVAAIFLKRRRDRRNRYENLDEDDDYIK